MAPGIDHTLVAPNHGGLRPVSTSFNRCSEERISSPCDEQKKTSLGGALLDRYAVFGIEFS